MQPDSLTCLRRWRVTACSAALLLGFAATPGVAQTAPVPSASAGGTTSGDASGMRENGRIAWYGKKFAGRRTASGQRYNPEALTMAHKTLPFGTQVRVTNIASKASVTLRVNDRGPTQADRIADVSQAAARKLGMVHAGVIDAELEVVSAAPMHSAKQ